MIDTKTLTCSNCHGGDFIRLDDNEFKCTHCGSITIVQDDVAKRLEQILLKMQTPAAASPQPRKQLVWMAAIVGVLIMIPLLTNLLSGVGSHRSGSHSFNRPLSRPDVDPGLLKVEGLKRVDDKLIGLVRNDSDRVVERVELTVHVYDGALRKDDQSGTLNERLLPGESLPITFWPWRYKGDERIEIADKQVRTEDDFVGRAQLRVSHQQIIREDKQLRFIGQLSDADTVPAKSINVSITLFDAKGKLIGAGHGTPDSSELARGETTNFSVSIDSYNDADVASMQYLVDSERVTEEAPR